MVAFIFIVLFIGHGSEILRGVSLCGENRGIGSVAHVENRSCLGAPLRKAQQGSCPHLSPSTHDKKKQNKGSFV